MRRLRKSAAAAGSLGVALCLVLACGRGSAKDFIGPNPETPSPVLERLSVVPRRAELRLGDSVELVAYGHFTNGDSAAVPAIWRSSLGPISEAGWYRAEREGVDTVSGTSQAEVSLAATALLTAVNPLDLAVVQLEPQEGAVPAGRPVQFVARTTGPDGRDIAAEVTWSSTGGTISSTGVFSALGPLGTYQITAQVRGRAPSGSAALTLLPPVLDTLALSPASTVLAVGESQQFLVTGRWSDGATTLPALTWSATGGTLTGSGRYTAGQVAGTFRVIVANPTGDRADTSVVTVTRPAPTLTRIILTPATVGLASGATRQFAVAASWSDGTTTPAPAVTYSAAGGAITATGLYTAGTRAGSFPVIAIQQGGTKADTSLVTISAPTATLTRLVVGPKDPILAPGGTVQFAVTGSWSDGSSAVPAVTYAATGGTIAGDGWYTAGATPGPYRVIATAQAGGRADTARLTIAVARVAAVDVAPSPATAVVGQPIQLSAILRDANGVVLTGRLVTWTSANPLIASVSPTGLVTTVAAGNTSVTASSEGVVRSIPVTVQAPLLFSDGFEGGTIGNFFQVACCAYSAAVQRSVRRSGLASLRTELRLSDSVVGDSKRSEVRLTSGAIVGGVGSERWYGLSIYIPGDWAVDTNWQDYQILAQWHNLPDTELGEGYTPPPLAIWINKGDWNIWSYWDPSPVTQLIDGGPAAPGGRAMLWKGAFDRGRWTDWVVHVKWSYGPDGQLEIWKDGQMVVSRTGPNTYNDRRALYFMVGMYKWMWHTPGLVWSQPTRVAFFDELRIAGAGGTYGTVAPR